MVHDSAVWNAGGLMMINIISYGNMWMFNDSHCSTWSMIQRMMVGDCWWLVSFSIDGSPYFLVCRLFIKRNCLRSCFLTLPYHTIQYHEPYTIIVNFSYSPSIFTIHSPSRTTTTIMANHSLTIHSPSSTVSHWPSSAHRHHGTLAGIVAPCRGGAAEGIALRERIHCGGQGPAGVSGTQMAVTRWIL